MQPRRLLVDKGSNERKGCRRKIISTSRNIYPQLKCRAFTQTECFLSGRLRLAKLFLIGIVELKLSRRVLGDAERRTDQVVGIVF